MSSWSFRDLDLGGVEAERGGVGLKPGRYVCKVAEAKIEDTKSGDGKKLIVTLNEINGQGRIMDFINVVNKSAQAADIGKRRLKAILEFGGHPNPNHPGDVSSMTGLVVGVNVTEGDEYTARDGTSRKGIEVRAYFDPAELGYRRQTSSSSASSDHLNSDIPF